MIREAKEKLGLLIVRLILAVLIGAVCGVLGTLFHIAVDRVVELRTQYSFIIWLMPVIGVVIVLLYKGFKTTKVNTASVMEDAVSGSDVSFKVLPAVFIGTVLTHMAGGSSGREGSALQMGASIGSSISRLFRAGRKNHRIAIISGMAAFFTALFGTPIAASFFSMMVLFVGVTVYEAYLPVLLSCLCSYFISLRLGVVPTRFKIASPDISVSMLLKVSLFALLCGVVAICFFKVIHLVAKLFQKIRNEYIRVIIGSGCLILSFILIGSQRYMGAGMDVIGDAILNGKALPYDFAVKLLLTAITLGCGFKGGEVIPAFFVGSTFGAMISPLIGIDARFGAAVGLIAVFCAATNTLVPSIFLAIEMFSGAGILYFVLACMIADFVSGHDGLYSSQKTLTEDFIIETYKLDEYSYADPSDTSSKEPSGSADASSKEPSDSADASTKE